MSGPNPPTGTPPHNTLPSPQSCYRFQGYEVDCLQWQVRYLGEPLNIHRKSFDLLIYLIAHRERVVGKDELLQAVWPDQFVEENNLSQQVSLLRKALAQPDANVKVIETVSGRGYRFLPQVEPVPPAAKPDSPAADSLTASPLAADHLVLTAHESVTRITMREEAEDRDPATGAPHALPSGHAQRRIWPVVTAALLTLVVLTALGAWAWKQRQEHSSGPPLQVVLMPLQGSTGDTVLDRALAETFRSDLLQSPFVSVVPNALVAAAMQHMQRKAAEPADLSTAREVCERTNSQAVIASTLARNGGHFLLTGEATGCADGETVSMTSQEASRAEELPGAIARLTNTLRRKLGESRSSIVRFNLRMADGDFGNTASLEALKAESEAGRLNHTGKFSEAILMSQRAIGFDPSFAGAYYDLGVSYSNLNDMPNARKALTHAFDLRSNGSPLFVLTVTARYQAVVTGDLFAAERNAIAWTGMYPRSVVAWNSLTEIETELGKIAEQKNAAEHALALRPDIGTLYYNLAEGQRSGGDPDASRATCDRAIAAGLDDEPIHMALLRLAFVQRDRALLAAQGNWLAAHPRSPSLVQIFAEIAVAEGRFAEARHLAARTREIELENGVTSAADASIKTIAQELIGAGDIADGSAMFHSVPLDPDDGKDIQTLAMLGDLPKADQLLAEKLARFPEDTLAQRWYGPMVRAAESIAAHNFARAADVLEPTRPFDDRGYAAADLRGNVRLAAGQPQAAEAEFRRSLAGAANDSVSYTIPLAWLGLARSLAAEGNRAAAAEAYSHFLTLWANADPDAALLHQARQEAAALNRR